MKDKIKTDKNEQEFFNQFLESIPEDTKNYVRLSMDIASQINAMLKNKDLTQRDLADKLEKKESEISKWLSGNHNFTIKSLAKIETVLEQQFLFTREEITDRFLPFLFRQFKHIYSENHYNQFINFYCMNTTSSNNTSVVFPTTSGQQGKHDSDKLSIGNTIAVTDSINYYPDNPPNKAA